tara:strand:- start:2042 stop:2674 length:633 start_codon:yes stop_codon:yes gene_type:complete
MSSKYKQELIENVFSILNDEQALFLMGLSLASNDLCINLESMANFSEEENIYFFVNSLSIIREIAKLVEVIENSDFMDFFSKNSIKIFNELKAGLVPFHDTSLTKSVLKPIRDLSFHYNLNASKEIGAIDKALDYLLNLRDIPVGFNEKEEVGLSQRYMFADTFRTKLVFQYLTTAKVSKISLLSVNVVQLVDSLLNDLLLKLRRQNNDG